MKTEKDDVLLFFGRGYYNKNMKKIVLCFLLICMCAGLASCKTETKDEIDQLIDHMSLREKAAQLLIPSIRYSRYVSENDYAGMTQMDEALRALLEENNFGGVILFSENIRDADQAIRLIEDIKEANQNGDHIPLLISADQEGGNVRRIPFGTLLCGNMALSATYEENDVISYASIIADELSDLGINTDFAPVVDVNSNPENPVIGIRSFSDDPLRVSTLCKPYIETLHEKGVLSCLKHFPGHGDTDTDSHSCLPVVDKSLEEIREFELLPFKAGIEAGCDMIMTAHIQYPQIETQAHNGIILPATLSHVFLSDILRDELGFDKVIVTDSLAMDAIDNFFRKKDILKYAINAGADMLLIPVSDKKSVSLYYKELENVITALCNLVKEGEITEERIDESLRRILTLKKDRGLFDTKEENKDIGIGSIEHHKEEMRIAKDAITLIENNNALPIKEGEKTIVLAPYASQYRSMQYARTLLTDEGFLKDKDDLVIYTYGSDSSEKDFKDNIVPLLKEADKIILISAVYELADMNGAEAFIIERCIDYGKDKKIPTVLLSSHLPYDISRYDADAIIACYYATGITAGIDTSKPGNYSFPPNLIAAMYVIYGESSPKGRLPITVPKLIKKDGLYSFLEETAYERGYSISY